MVVPLTSTNENAVVGVAIVPRLRYGFTKEPNTGKRGRLLNEVAAGVAVSIIVEDPHASSEGKTSNVWEGV